MKAPANLRWFVSFTGFLITCHAALGAGIVTAATESNLRAALTNGGLVKFAVDGTITLTNTLFITTNTILDGSGHIVKLSGGSAVRVLWVVPNVNLTLQQLTIADAYVTDGGGGLYNYGHSRILNCTFSNNVADNGGGGIWHGGGTLVVNGSTFVNNRSHLMDGISAISVNQPSGSAAGFAITNCTFTGNSNGTDRVTISGINLSAPSWIVNCTVVSNIHGGMGFNSPFFPQAKAVTVVNTISAYNQGVDFTSWGSGFLIDAGHNISSDTSLTNSTSINNINPKVGPLTNNGGPTWTMALLPESPAIDAGESEVSLQKDQRGLHRFVGTCDIGAFEFTPGMAINGKVDGWRVPPGITLSAGTNTVSATSDGRYLFFGLNASNQVVTPRLDGWVFLPNNLTILVQPCAFNVNFKAYQTNFLTPELPGPRFIFAEATGRVYQVLASTNLKTWGVFSTNTVSTNGTFEVLDANPLRFFRTLRLQ